jgi:hypothetical protein
MPKQSWIVNLVLLAAVAGLAMKLRGDWLRANTRYGRLAPAAAATPAPQAGMAATPSVTGAELIVANNLFSPDRNNTVVLVAESKPAPPDPLLIGAMDLGSSRLALMTEGGERPGPVKQVKEGEIIGGYKLVKIDSDFVTVEYEGQKKRIDVTTVVPQVNAPAAAAQQPRVAQPAIVGPNNPPPANVVTAAKPTPTNPSGNSTGDATKRSSFDMFGPGVQDTYPAGAVVNGWKKVEHPWPFGGKQVWWEKVQQ